jgi:hypothetical protein
VLLKLRKHHRIRANDLSTSVVHIPNPLSREAQPSVSGCLKQLIREAASGVREDEPKLIRCIVNPHLSAFINGSILFLPIACAHLHALAAHATFERSTVVVRETWFFTGVGSMAFAKSSRCGMFLRVFFCFLTSARAEQTPARSDESLSRPLYFQIVNPADTMREREPATQPSEQSYPPAPRERLRTFELPPVTVVGERPPELKEEERVGPNEQPRWTAER